MPIYAYKCESCGFAKDVLQKMSDAPLEVCPSCSHPTFKKQVTAAGFRLKGSGWYATDFKGGGTPSTTAATPTDAGAATTESKPDTAKPEGAKTESAPTPTTPAAASGG